MVTLLSAALPEYRGCSAAVTEVFESHCAVVVLDESLQCGIGECWPYFKDVLITSTGWRIGNRVTINGLRNKRHAKLNGLTGVVCSHPTHGHPCFVQKASVPDQLRLTICVKLDDCKAAGQKSVLLEPRFFGDYVDAVAQLSSIVDKLGPVHRSKNPDVALED